MKLFCTQILLCTAFVFGFTAATSAMQENNQDTFDRKKSLKLLRAGKQKKLQRTLYDKNLSTTLQIILEEAQNDQRTKRELEGPDWSPQHRTIKSFDIIDGQPYIPTPEKTDHPTEDTSSLFTRRLLWFVGTACRFVPDTRDDELERREQSYNNNMHKYASMLIDCFGSRADQMAGRYKNTMLRDITDNDLQKKYPFVTQRLKKLMRLNNQLALLNEPAITRALSSLNTFILRNQEILRQHKQSVHKFKREQLLALAEERTAQEEQTKTHDAPLSDDDLFQIALLDKKRTQQVDQQQ